MNADRIMDLEDKAEELKNTREDYLHGRCHALAIALHELTGKPLRAAIEYDSNIKRDALVHAWIQWDDDYIVDVGCLREERDMFKDFYVGYFDVIEIDTTALTRLGGEVDRFQYEAAMKVARDVMTIALEQVQAGALEL